MGMLPLYLNAQILSLLWESQASELGSRMAMKAATDNAKEVARKLEIIYNRKRQAQITAEIAEISSGAAAIEDAEGGNVKALGMYDTEESVTEEFLSEIDGDEVPESPLPAWEKYPAEWFEGLTPSSPMKGARAKGI